MTNLFDECEMGEKSTEHQSLSKDSVKSRIENDVAGDVRPSRRVYELKDVIDDRHLIKRPVPSTSLLIESLIQQLCTMFEDDPIKRNKLYFSICDRLFDLKLIDGSYNADEFEGLRGQYQRALYQLVTRSIAATGCENILPCPTQTNEIPRYQRDFKELNFIASGGFGHVYKAQHRLDGHEYAIKKICVKLGRLSNILQHLQEVKTLAKLNHINIVPYKGAWIERSIPEPNVPCLRDTPDNLDDSNNKISEKRVVKRGRKRRITLVKKKEDVSSNGYSSGRSSFESTSSDGNKQDSDSKCGSYSNKLKYNIQGGMYTNHCKAKFKQRRSNSDSIVVNNNFNVERLKKLNSETTIIGKRINNIGSNINSKDNDDSKDTSDVVSFRNDDGMENVCNDCSISSPEEESDIEEIGSSDSDSTNDSNDNQKLCSYNSFPSHQFTLYIQMSLCEQTLRQWLDKNEEPIDQSIITKILTQILCGLNYIHSRGMVHHDIKPSNIFIVTSGELQIQLGDFGLACPLQRESHQPILGTHLYVANEQLDGQCDPKSDVYSLGIILYELLVPMKTTMERTHMISKLKLGVFPELSLPNYSKWVEIIKRLINPDPKLRPSTTELLQDLNDDKDTIIAKLINDNNKQAGIIQDLVQENKQLREELIQLQSEMMRSKI